MTGLGQFDALSSTRWSDDRDGRGSTSGGMLRGRLGNISNSGGSRFTTCYSRKESTRVNIDRQTDEQIDRPFTKSLPVQYVYLLIR